MHIGGARTALFNYLYAKRNNGKFLLRIEDTDRQRSTKEAVDAIIDGLKWLGLEHDGEITYQFSRADRHKEVALELVKAKKAFFCYMTEEETQKARDEAHAEGRALRSIYRDSEEVIEGKPYVVRLRAPDEGSVIVNDEVQGKVETQAKNIDDLILLRSDGTPTYMLAVVVDDYDMGITHIIRGDDHLTNAARQSVIINAMGWNVPVYAHIPLIHGDDGKKLSKRHGALAVGEYANMGYLPESINSYLLRLGWSHGDLDIVPIEDAIKIFDLNGLGKSPSRLDFKKLDQVNAHFMRLADAQRLCTLLYNLAEEKNISISESKRLIIEKAIPELVERAKNIIELIDQTKFLWIESPISYTEKANKLIASENKPIIASVHELLNALQHWDRTTTHDVLKTVAQEREVGLGKIGPVIRAALTGGLVAPDLGICMELLGKSETLVRLEHAQR